MWIKNPEKLVYFKSSYVYSPQQVNSFYVYHRRVYSYLLSELRLYNYLYQRIFNVSGDLLEYEELVNIVHSKVNPLEKREEVLLKAIQNLNINTPNKDRSLIQILIYASECVNCQMIVLSLRIFFKSFSETEDPEEYFEDKKIPFNKIFPLLDLKKRKKANLSTLKEKLCLKILHLFSFKNPNFNVFIYLESETLKIALVEKSYSYLLNPLKELSVVLILPLFPEIFFIDYRMDYETYIRILVETLDFTLFEKPSILNDQKEFR